MKSRKKNKPVEHWAASPTDTSRRRIAPLSSNDVNETPTPCWWFELTDTYKDVLRIALASDNLNDKEFRECFENAKQRAMLFKPNLVAHIDKILLQQRSESARGPANEWGRRFLVTVENDSTAREAWRELEQAGLGIGAGILLSQYAHGDGIVRDVYTRGRRIADAQQVAKRAITVAKAKKTDKRAALFARRAAEKIRTAEQTPWINPYAREKTLAEAVAAHPELSGMSVEEFAEKAPKFADTVRRHGNTPLLLILRDYASKHGVRLGWNRLGALAACADPERQEDPQNLSRLANSPEMEWARPRYLENFERQLALFSNRT